MKTVKGTKELMRIRHIKSGPIIAYVINSLAILAHKTELDSGIVHFRSKFERISKQVFQNDMYHSRVAHRCQLRLYVEGDPAFRLRIFYIFGNLACGQSEARQLA